MKIAFTGPRRFRPREDLTQIFNNRLQQLSIQPEEIQAVVGGAQGFDFAISQALIELNIETWLKLPNPGYINYYWSNQPEEVQWMKDNLRFAGYSSQTIYVVDESGRKVHSNFIRNQHMIDRADMLIVGTRQPWRISDITGGTGHAVRYAHNTNKRTEYLFNA